MVSEIAEKSGLPAMAAIDGVNRSLTMAVTTAPNAPPITTATARSRTLPRITNCRNPLNMAAPLRHCNERSSALRSLVGGGRNCYDRGQVRFRAAVITLAIAIAAAPVMFDACLFTCHAPQTGDAGAVASCHHASGSGARFRALPVPCGHDHGGLVAALEPSSRGVRDISGQP